VDLSAVISLDATRANPTWRADENVLRLLLELREFSEKEVVTQTRTAPDHVLNCASAGTTQIFYDEELALRETLNYPPFATFLLLSWQGDQAVVEKVETEIKSRTEKFKGSFYSNPLSTEAKILRHALFRLPAKDAQIGELNEILRSFPPYIKIEVDPNRIV
jgi:primosomal protein N'